MLTDWHVPCVLCGMVRVVATATHVNNQTVNTAAARRNGKVPAGRLPKPLQTHTVYLLHGQAKSRSTYHFAVKRVTLACKPKNTDMPVVVSGVFDVCIELLPCLWRQGCGPTAPWAHANPNKP